VSAYPIFVYVVSRAGRQVDTCLPARETCLTEMVGRLMV